MSERLLTSGSGRTRPRVKTGATDHPEEAAMAPGEPPIPRPDVVGAEDPWAEVAAGAPQRLLDAAVEAFADRGFHATTTRDIAQRAGLSPAGLYVHYASKGALLGHLSRVGHAAALRLVERALALPGDPPRRLHALVAAFVAWHAEHHTVARVVQYELRALEPADREVVTELRRRLERLVESEVRRGVADGTLATDHPRQATRAILSLGVDVARWYEPTGRESPVRLGRVYADLALRMLGAQPPGADDTAVDDEEIP
jgi:AcrR family transcriptional regulator